MISAINMPFWPPKIRPMNISSSVSAVSRNAVLKVFPIKSPRDIDAIFQPLASSLRERQRRGVLRKKVNSAVALDGPGKRLIQCRLGFGVFRVGNLHLLMFEFQLEELLFEALEQRGVTAGSGSCRSCD